jgi:hypothetical protein
VGAAGRRANVARHGTRRGSSKPLPADLLHRADVVVRDVGALPRPGIACVVGDEGRYAVIGVIFLFGIAALALYWLMARFEVANGVMRERTCLWWREVDLNRLTAATLGVKSGPEAPAVTVLLLTDADDHHYTLNLFGVPKELRLGMRSAVRSGLDHSSLAVSPEVTDYLDPSRDSNDMVGLGPVRWGRSKGSPPP